MGFCCRKARVKGADPYCHRTKDWIRTNQKNRSTNV